MSELVARADADQRVLGPHHGELLGCDGARTPVMPDFEHVDVAQRSLSHQWGHHVGFGVPGQQRAKPAVLHPKNHTRFIGGGVRYCSTRPYDVEPQPSDIEHGSSADFADAIRPHE